MFAPPAAVINLLNGILEQRKLKNNSMNNFLMLKLQGHSEILLSGFGIVNCHRQSNFRNFCCHAAEVNFYLLIIAFAFAGQIIAGENNENDFAMVARKSAARSGGHRAA